MKPPARAPEVVIRRGSELGNRALTLAQLIRAMDERKVTTEAVYEELQRRRRAGIELDADRTGEP